MNALIRHFDFGRSAHLPDDLSGAAPALPRSKPAARFGPTVLIPGSRDEMCVRLGGRTVELADLRMPLWDSPRITKGDLLRYYVGVAPVLLPHLRDRALLLQRYPYGVFGGSVAVKHPPSTLPEWVEICSIRHPAGEVVDFVVVRDLPSLLWLVNFGCIDLQQWYGPRDAVDRPDALIFELTPVANATFAQVRETALIVHDALAALGIRSYAKSSGFGGMQILAPITRGPAQATIRNFGKELARGLAAVHDDLITVEPRVSKRREGRVLVAYDQNTWDRTVATVYSVCPEVGATVSAPVTWAEVERGFVPEDFRIDTVKRRVRKLGDLWAPLLARRKRFRLETVL